MPKSSDPLFWIALDTDGGRRIFLQRAMNSSSALVHASIGGMKGHVRDVQMLTETMARKVPKPMIGTALSQRQAEALLKKIGR
jgi:hypothetical protein